MVYLIHFTGKLHHAGHYIGFCEEDLDARMARHRAGQGSKLLRALNEAGIRYDVVAIWPEGTRDFERQLKNRKNASFYCPLCREAKLAYKRGERMRAQ